MGRIARHLASTLATTLVVLWTLDVLLHTGLAANLAGEIAVLGPLDLLGLLAMLAQLAVAAAVSTLLIALLTRRLPPRGGWTGESAALLCGALVGIALLAGMRHSLGLRGAQTQVALAIACVAGGLVWLLARRRVHRQREISWGFARTTPLLLLPALAAGLGCAALGLVTRGHWGEAALLALLTSTALIAAVIGRRSLSAPLAWLPVLGSVALALYGAAGLRVPGGWEARPSIPGDDLRVAHGDPPSIVLIVLDTVRADHLQRYGYHRNTMPALERWADRALVATRAIAPGGWTMPTHVSIFSGLHVSEHGVHYSTLPPTRAGERPVLGTLPYPDLVWLPETLAAHGYRSIAVSANQLALPRSVAGFDQVHLPRRLGWYHSTIGMLVDRLSPLAALSEMTRWRLPYVGARSTVEIVKRVVPDDPRPLFLFVNLLDAHAPYNPPVGALRSLGVRPPRLFSRYANNRELTREWESLPPGKRQCLVDLYDGELRGLDIELARLLEWIDARFAGRAMVIITADHGEELGEEGRVGHEYGLSQTLIHVPLFLRGPGIDNGPLETPVTLRALHDFMITVARGRTSLDALTRIGAPGLLAERYASTYNMMTLGPEYGRPWVALLEGGKKAVGPTTEGLTLFDLEGDGFNRDRPIDEPETAARLGARIDTYWEEFQDRRDYSTLVTPSEDEIEHLRSLGYIQ